MKRRAVVWAVLIGVFVASTPRADASSMGGWSSVDMSVSCGGEDRFCRLFDSLLRVNLSGTRDPDGSLHLSGFVDDSQSLFLEVSPDPDQAPARGYTISGAGLSATVEPLGADAYSVSGNVDANGFSLRVSRFGSGYNIDGLNSGNLRVDGANHDLTVSGFVDLAFFGKKSVAVLGAALAAVDSGR